MISVFLLFILYQYLLINPPHEATTKVRNTSFTSEEIQDALRRYEQRKAHYQVTGIVLHWQRLTGVQRLVRTMLDFDDVFTNIIVWNNNPKPLTYDDLQIDTTAHLEIINSETNIKDLAKYRACERAKTNACFYVDDDWDIRLYVRSLYSSFLLEPTVLHAITDQFTYFTNLMWSYFDRSIDLHTGFSWIGCGSMFSRENAIRHLKYLDLFLHNEKNQDLMQQADHFFSIWFNQVPAQFNGRVLHSEEGAMSSFENLDFESLQYRASILSIQILENTLRSSPHSTLFSRRRASNSLVSLTKSTCSYNDRFIFLTNCSPIDGLEETPFNITVDLKRGTRANLPHTPNSPYREQFKSFGDFHTAQAVDNDTQTCWKVNRTSRSGDFYAIDFLTIPTHGNLSFFIAYQHRKSLQKRLEISISLDSDTWVVLPKQPRGAITYRRRQKLVVFHARSFLPGYRIFRFIRFMTLENDDEPLHVCEVQLID